MEALAAIIGKLVISALAVWLGGILGLLVGLKNNGPFGFEPIIGAISGAGIFGVLVLAYWIAMAQ